MKQPIYETEGYTEDNLVDTIWVLDGRGKLIEMEVADDVGDN